MYRGQTIHVREMYSRQIVVCKIEIILMDITLHYLLSSLQEPSKCLLAFRVVRKKEFYVNVRLFRLLW